MSSNANALSNLLVFPEDHQLVGLSNWAIFQDHLQSIAHSMGLSGYLDGTITAPASPAVGAPPAPAAAPSAAPPALTVTPINSWTPLAEEWELCDGQLAGIIYQNIKDPRSIRVTQDMTVHQMRTRLTNEYDTMSAAAQALAKEYYFKQLEALHKAASDVGCTVQDEDLRSHFLTSLPLDHLWILQTHDACSYSDLKCALLEYDMMVESANSSATSSVTSNALVVSGKTNNSVVCNNCRHMVHVKAKCWACGGGSEGKGPCWYTAPKCMELTTTISAVTVESTSVPAIAAATIYDFGDYDFGDWDGKLLPF
ncbi:hypothetical protein GYMLUDRAFT_253205 [Collybiopsis luxurians FD-317 M1]|uniref:Uncharacterized protein n=1 Tax=Collybiopsis luxurians FD-317 M1 TaxID=944289 RepID=A0A0D0BXI2_9AGAR|nr:hypothetical protein GYMLUDRAFT_253205 [Collybiopsis luxurians FD-317 M1]